ncbi:hypothetical protein SBV1_1140012 [Verrucomicrobia bacterium]|nr:hypothetical protein SBV1_1140012 [Verrucomicrobiota bacterium]
MKRAKFCDLVPGTRFRHNDRVYVKLQTNLARNEDQRRLVFPTDLAVELIGKQEGPAPGGGESPPVPRDGTRRR